MQRHDFDPVALLFGGLFAIVAAGYALTHNTGLRLHWSVAVSAAALVVGATVVAMAARHQLRTSQRPADDTDSAPVDLP